MQKSNMNYFQLVLMAMAIFMPLAQTEGIYKDFARINPASNSTNTAAPNVVPTMITETAAHAARGLLNASSWGVLSTIAYDRMNTPPFGNVVSYSDGGLGSPYFYLTGRDNSTLNHALKDPRCSLTISQFPLGTCVLLDPQDQHLIRLDPQEPVCAKLTLSGKLRKVQILSKEFAFANATLFDRHPRYNMLPPFFEIYKLDVSDIFVIRSYKRRPERPSVEEYYGINL